MDPKENKTTIYSLALESIAYILKNIYIINAVQMK